MSNDPYYGHYGQHHAGNNNNNNNYPGGSFYNYNKANGQNQGGYPQAQPYQQQQQQPHQHQQQAHPGAPAGNAYYNTGSPSMGHARTSSYGSNDAYYGYGGATMPQPGAYNSSSSASSTPSSYPDAYSSYPSSNYYNSNSNSHPSSHQSNPSANQQLGGYTMPQPRPNSGGMATTVSPLDFASHATYQPATQAANGTFSGAHTTTATTMAPTSGGGNMAAVYDPSITVSSNPSSYQSSPVPAFAQQHSPRQQYQQHQQQQQHYQAQQQPMQQPLQQQQQQLQQQQPMQQPQQQQQPQPSSRPQSQASSTHSNSRPISMPTPIDTTYRPQPQAMVPVSPLDSSDDDDYSPTPLDVMRKVERNNQNKRASDSHQPPPAIQPQTMPQPQRLVPQYPPAMENDATHVNGQAYTQPQPPPQPSPRINTSNNIVEPSILSPATLASASSATTFATATTYPSSMLDKVLPPPPAHNATQQSPPMTSATPATDPFSPQHQRVPSITSQAAQQPRPTPPRHSTSSLSPSVNAALLSELSSVFVRRIKALENVRELYCANEYPDSFSGTEAVRAIFKTLDEKIPEQYCVRIATTLMHNNLFKPVHYSQKSMIAKTVFNSLDQYYYFGDDGTKDDVPRGVLTCLTKCYSTSCVPGQGGCYSPMCPNKTDFFANEFAVETQLLPETSQRASVQEEMPILSEGYVAWGQQVDRELFESTPQRERDRQEAINEVIFNEENYMKDLITIHEVMVTPLLEGNFIEPNRRKQFVRDVFANYYEIRDISTALYKDLYEQKRRYEKQCLPGIGETIVQHVAYFEKPYTKFGPQVPMSEHLLMVENRNNPEFARWFEEVNKNPRLRRLGFRAFLVTPALRMGRFQLLLEAVLKKTDKDHHDYTFLTRCIDMTGQVASKVNALKDATDQRVEILRINDALDFKQGESYNLRLTDPHRKLYHSGELKRQSDRSDIFAYVFDHMLIMTKVRKTNNGEEYRVWKRPIPMQMLIVPANAALPPVPISGGASAYPLQLNQLSQGGHQHLFFCNTAQERQQWIKAIEDAKSALKRRQGSESDALEIHTLDDSSFRVFGGATTGGQGRINCSVPFVTVENEYRIAIGTDTGVYFKSLKTNQVRRVINCENVRQLDVLDSHNILLVLADKMLYAYPLDALNDRTNIKAPERLREEVDKGVNFFAVGMCNNKHLLVYKKRNATDSLFVAMEPKADVRDSRNDHARSGRRNLFGRSNQSLFRKEKDFNIGGVDATNLQFFRTKLNVACDQRCFQVINPNNLSDIRDIPDNSFPEFNFISHSAEPMKPLAMFRIEKFFLVCYDRVAFYVHNRNGALVVKNDGKPYILCEWEGHPDHVVYIHPYVVGICSQFLEVRNVETGELVQVIPGENIRLTYYDEQLNIVHCCMTHTQRPEVQHLFHLYLDPTKARNTGYPSRRALVLG
ncbi:CNH domain-containing protein [Gongronella butleri]|nr:CNH domain-containing protein [Gongronella butleri]